MFLRKLLLSFLSLTLSSAAIAEELEVTKVDKSAAADSRTCVMPEWPKAALRKGQTGTVTLMFLISPSGQVADAAIVGSSGHESLDGAALEGIRKCKFTPGMEDGKPVTAWMKMQYVWMLEDGSERPALIKQMNQYHEKALKGDVDALYKLAKAFASLGTAEHVAQAARQYQRAAALGHPGAMFELSNAERYGKGLPQNRPQAMIHLRKAAELGFAEAQYALGMIYQLGSDGEERDFELAAAWIRKAADQGHPKAQNVLGEMYMAGQGVATDPAQAVKWFHKSASSGLIDAQRRYAHALLAGRGTDRDFEAGAGWLRKAADQRDPVAEGFLGLLYFTGHGVDVDIAEAFKLLNRAAYASQPRFQVILGDLHAKGVRTHVDRKKANALYRRAAELGSADGMNNIGYSYEMGYEVNQDYAAAMDWYVKAAAKGNENSKAGIGNLYQNGLGVEKDVATALKWYTEAAEQKSEQAMHRIGSLYEHGIGVEKNLATALDWYGKAATQGDEPAMRRLGAAHINGELGLPVNAELGKQWLKTAELRQIAIFSPEGFKPPPVK